MPGIAACCLGVFLSSALIAAAAVALGILVNSMAAFARIGDRDEGSI